jgi:hypothetical protein
MLPENKSSVWVIEVAYKYDHGIYRIYTDEDVARKAYKRLVESNEWGTSPKLSHWVLDMPYELKRGEKCFKQLSPDKSPDIPFSKFAWEE